MGGNGLGVADKEVPGFRTVGTRLTVLALTKSERYFSVAP